MACKTIIKAIGTATPPLYVTQTEAFSLFDTKFNLSPQEKEFYRKILLNGSIRGRYIAFHSLEDATESDQDRLIERFLFFGRKIAVEAAQLALQKAGLKAEEIGTIVVNTCTGYLCPGLSSYVAEALGMRNNVRPLDIMGMGCGGAMPNLQTTANILAADGNRPALSISVEICTATLFMDPDPGVIISNSIFGDGAAAVILQQVEDARDEGVKLIDYETALHPEYRPYLQYRTESHRLRNVLTKEVPVIGARVISGVVDNILKRNHLTKEDIPFWIVHAGGTQVLDQLAKKLGFKKDVFRYSYDIFNEFGNMSSPTVLFVLKRILEEAKPARGQKGLMLSFGAGFTAFAALVEF